jgi:predicted RND superfamily exporter protein
LQNFVAFLHKIVSTHRTAVLVSAMLLAAGGFVLSSQLSVKSDMSYLLPESSHSVQQLRAIEKRARVTAAFLLGVESDEPKARQAATDKLLQKLKALQSPDIGSITVDDRVARQFAWQNRFLFTEEKDLIAVRDALQAELRKQNPFYVPLNGEDDQDGNVAAKTSHLEELDKKLREAEERAKTPEPLLSPDKRLQMIIIQAIFADGDLDRGRKMAATLQGLLDETAREMGPAVRTGMSADVVRGLVEQSGLIHGMALATTLTLIAVIAALLIFFRSVGSVACLCWSLTVGTLITFAVAKLIVGHLNIASAFLSSIVVGNGINFGILVLARYCEERRRGTSADEAVRLAMVGSANGTAAAALAAGVAYLSLIATPFRGFRDFGIIGGAGMVLCWLSAYTVLPAGLSLFAQWGWIRVRPERGAAAWFGRILARPPRIIVPLASVLFVVTAVGAWRYVTGHHYETNLRNLGSAETVELQQATAWTRKFDLAFGSGIAGGFAIVVSDRSDVTGVVESLRAADAGKPEKKRTFARISSLEDVLPSAQANKLRVLSQIRRILDKKGDLLDNDMKSRSRLKPPGDLRALADADVPSELAWPFTERDGSRGRIILANSGEGIDTWHTDDLRRFVDAVRMLHLKPNVLVGGSSFVFQDMLDDMERDGPRTTMLAGVGAIIIILVLVGANGYGVVTLLCGLFGTMALLTTALLWGIKINFLDFVALPITIGIGMDYAANITSRIRQELRHRRDTGGGGTQEVGRTAMAVALCSYTTVVGYGSLLISQNRGIRSFGLSAMIGEITCLTAALLIAPALAARLRRPA